MPSVNITIKNLPQIKRAFGMAPSLMRRNMRTAIDQSLKIIEFASRNRTPVDTGRLRSSHRSRLTSDFSGEVGTHVNYDIFVHEGTRYMKARPFLMNAVQANQHNVDKAFEMAVQKTLDEIGRRT